MKKLFAAIAISMVGTAAMAQDTGWYVGGAFGQSKAKGFCDELAGLNVTCDDSDVAIKGIGGYQFSRNFALEMGLTTGGSAEVRGSGGRLAVDFAVLEGTAVGILPLSDKFSFFGKLGIYTSAVEWELRTTTLNDEQKKTNSDFTYGIGVSFAVTPKLVLRGEYQRYNDVDAGDIGKGNVDIMSLGMVYRFF
jgi:OOP family OmpA-OmpF porin